MKILIITTSHGELGTTGRKTGVWLEELAIPYFAFKAVGADITLASPLGGPLPIDPRSESIIASTSAIRRFQKDPEVISLLAHSLPLDTMKAADFDMVFLPGGRGAMWDFPGNEPLMRLLESFIHQDKIIGLVSHAVSALISMQKGNSEPFVKDMDLTAASNSEEQLAGFTDQLPFSLESTLISLKAYYSKAADYNTHTVTNGHLVTGQNGASSADVAKKMLLLLKEVLSKTPAAMPY